MSFSIPSARYTDKADGISSGNACFWEQAVKRPVMRIKAPEGAFID